MQQFVSTYVVRLRLMEAINFQMDTAVKFLKNPKIAPSPMSTKKAFLKSKGLTEDEINQACQTAGISPDDTQYVILPFLSH